MATFKRTGTLHGTNTIDTVVFSVDLPAEITYTVKAIGQGHNKMRVRCGQQLVAIWAQIHDFELEPGQSATRSFHTGIDGTLPTTDGKQDVRIRMSRDLTTKEMEWELTYSVN